MKMNSAYQMVLPIFEGMLVRSGVMTLCVFKPEVIKDSGYAGDRLCGGQHSEVAYSSWLKFWSPLSHSVNTCEL